MALCPEVFVLNDDGYAETRHPDVPNEYDDAVTDAADACPEHAIVTE